MSHFLGLHFLQIPNPLREVRGSSPLTPKILTRYGLGLYEF
jgi:hypothetical protein